MDLKLPNLGEGADSGTVVNLFVKVGDHVKQDQPVLELENEKAVATIPATAEGIVAQLYVNPGDRLSVGQRILSLSVEGKTGGPAAQMRPRKSPSEEMEAGGSKSEPMGDRRHVQEREVAGERETKGSIQSEDPKAGVVPAASPSIRKLARELGLDLTRIRGSERGGRIVMADLKAYVQRLQQLAGQAQGKPASATSLKPVPESIDFSKWGRIVKKPLTQLRKVISRRMAENWTTIPHVTQFDEVDITALLDLRKKYAIAYEQKGARLTLTTFALKAVIAALKKHPVFNASLDEAADEIVIKEYYHLGLAVDTDAGLIVPVIRDVDKKSLLELAREVEDLAKKARERKISADELRGGTFTISNQGGIGGAHFTPIVNKPEVAILGLGRGVLKPVVKENQVVPRVMLPIAISYDHRVIDGGSAARFTVDLLQAFGNFNEEDVRT